MKTFAARILLLTFVAFALTTCKKKDDDNTPAPTCSDGIQNQGETGVDCGGPCSACPTVLCNGNGESKYQPLALNNEWVYTMYPAGNPSTTGSISQTVTHGSNTYFDM